MNERRFPIQATDSRGSVTIPWPHAEEAYKEYVAQFGMCQTLERIAERQGFGASEIVLFLVGRIKRLEGEMSKAAQPVQAAKAEDVQFEVEKQIALKGLIAVARSAHNLCDNTCDSGEKDEMTVERSDFEELSKALDVLDELPERPGYVSTGPAKAAWLLGTET